MDSGSEMMVEIHHVARKLKEENVVKLEPHWHICCVCHIMNSAVTDCETIAKPVIDKIRTTLRNIRISVALRVAFREVHVLWRRKNYNRPKSLR